VPLWSALLTRRQGNGRKPNTDLVPLWLPGCTQSDTPSVTATAASWLPATGGAAARTLDGPLKRTVILVVKDEAIIRMGTVQMLQDAGYKALDAANADIALDILEARNDIQAQKAGQARLGHQHRAGAVGAAARRRYGCRCQPGHLSVYRTYACGRATLRE
jgi:hypothetical protein